MNISNAKLVLSVSNACHQYRVRMYVVRSQYAVYLRCVH